MSISSTFLGNGSSLALAASKSALKFLSDQRPFTVWDCIYSCCHLVLPMILFGKITTG